MNKLRCLPMSRREKRESERVDRAQFLSPTGNSGLKLITAALIIFTAIPPLIAQETVEYRLELDITWSNETHPHPNGAFPYGPETWNEPHVSPVIGAVHSGEFVLWRDGAIASNALKACAETGSASEYRSVVETAISSGTAREVVATSGSESPGMLSTIVAVTSEMPLISFASMIAPTPDWYFGLESYSLFTNGEWVDSVEIPLYPYDAGTKEGDDYSYSYPETSPREPITSLRGVAPFSDAPVATVRLIRVNPVALSSPLSTVANRISFQGYRNGEFHYQFNTGGTFEFSLFNLSGQKIYVKNGVVTDNIISVPVSLSAGLYIAQLKTDRSARIDRVTLK